MSTTEIAIGALETGVRNLAKSLEKLGLKTEVNVHRSGHGGDYHHAMSYVELEVTGTYRDSEGEEEEASADVKFRANGYGDLTSGREIGGMDGWKAMKKVGLERIMNDLAKQGWRKP